MRVTADDQARIAAAIARAEATTSGEIFCVVATRVSSYRDIGLAWATAAALLLPLALIPLGLEPAWLPGMGDAWQAAHSTAVHINVGRALAAYAIIQAAIFLTAFLLTLIPGVRRRLTPRGVRRARVRKAALEQFMAHGLHLTEARTGVLIFASLADHQVEVVADKGIHALVDQDVWAEAVEALTREMRAGRPADGFEAAIALCGKVLAQHFPPRGANPNELPDRLVIL